jgi:hypothetical protein
MTTSPQSRKASQAAYDKLVTEGRLTRARKRVYDCVFNSGPIDQLRAHDLLQAGGLVAYSTVTGRFSELLQMGLLEIVGEVVNRRGSVVTLWDVTDREVPLTVPKRQSRLPDGSIDWQSRSRKLTALVLSAISATANRPGQGALSTQLQERLDRILEEES